ncbi:MULTISPECIES: hypothetical protein [Microvirga]|nr:MULTISPECIES: hypothetical protein [Microvirga]
MRRAEIWAAFNNALAVVMTIIVIATLFYSLPVRAGEGHSHEHQMAHGAYHYLYNGIMRPNVKNSSWRVSRVVLRLITSGSVE